VQVGRNMEPKSSYYETVTSATQQGPRRAAGITLRECLRLTYLSSGSASKQPN